MPLTSSTFLANVASAHTETQVIRAKVTSNEAANETPIVQNERERERSRKTLTAVTFHHDVVLAQVAVVKWSPVST